MCKPSNKVALVTGKGSDTFASMEPFPAIRIPQLLSYLSRFKTLLPGDVISTGTPAGVGLGFNPPEYLNPGDVVKLGIKGLITSKQQVKAYAKN